MKASNKENLFQNLLWFYTFFLLTKRKTRIHPNILNTKVYEYKWKIGEYICPKPHEKP